MTRKLIAVAGATATGKTALAVALARWLGGEIIGADSRQVYRGMDIGAAKPAPEEQAAARHHLIGVAAPDEPFSLGAWLGLAREALEDVWARGKQPLLVGGTGQYVWALLEGWRVPRVPPDERLRAELEARGAEQLLRDLREADPEAETYIDARNMRRVVRALEVYLATGRPFSYWRQKEPPPFGALVIGLRLDRDALYRRIDRRVDRMVEEGFVDEVRGLLQAGYGRGLPSMSGIGYREMAGYLAGESSLESAVARTKAGTHRLARHQNSWFKAGDGRIHWIAAGDGAAEEALRIAQEFLGDAAQTRAGGVRG
jgi:tRNA dimethylallyltransferase